MRVLLFVNGEFDIEDAEVVAGQIRPDDLIIAVDGGTRHAWAGGVTPHIVIGDLDSLLPEELARLRAAHTRIIPFSPDKDETDLELALRYSVEQGATEIVVWGALGGRLDQTLANVLLLTLPELAGIDVHIVARAGKETAFLIREAATITGKPGDTVSLIPLGGDALGVTTEGLKWELHHEDLRFGPARGVSNVLERKSAHIQLQSGMLLCVVIRV